MQQEISSGVVVIKRSGEEWSVMLIRDMKGSLTFPKGLMEQGESPENTALREAEEETGITGLTIETPLPDISYFYTREGQTIHKTVHYFLCTVTHVGHLHAQREEGISDIEWMPIRQALEVIGYEKSNKPLLEAASVWIKNH